MNWLMLRKVLIEPPVQFYGFYGSNLVSTRSMGSNQIAGIPSLINSQLCISLTLKSRSTHLYKM